MVQTYVHLNTFLFFLMLFTGWQSRIYAAQKQKFNISRIIKRRIQYIITTPFAKIFICGLITKFLHKIVFSYPQSPRINRYNSLIKFFGSISFTTTFYFIFQIDTIQNIQQWLHANILPHEIGSEITNIILLVILAGFGIDLFEIPITAESFVSNLSTILFPTIVQKIFHKISFEKLIRKNTKTTLLQKNDIENKQGKGRIFSKNILKTLETISRDSYPSQKSACTPFLSVLLHGPPGCGKSEIIKKIFLYDNEEVTTYYVYLTSNFVSSSRLLQLCQHIEKMQDRKKRLVIHIDELDIFTLKENQDLFVEFITELKSLAANRAYLSIVVMAATNNINLFPNTGNSSKIGSRFGYRIFVGPPDLESVRQTIDEEPFLSDLFKLLSPKEQTDWLKYFVRKGFTWRTLDNIFQQCKLAYYSSGVSSWDIFSQNNILLNLENS